MSNLDKGKTQTLLDSIAYSTNWPRTRDTLLNTSPLSDTVLITLIDHYVSQHAVGFKNIIVKNSPVSDIVYYYLNNVLDSMVSDLAYIIRNAQTSISNRTITAISSEKNGYENDYQLHLNNYIQFLVSSDTIGNDSIEKALSILSRKNDNGTKQMLISTYLADSNITEAQGRLNNFVPANTDESNWKSLTNLLLSYAQSGKTVFDMTESEETYVRSIANDNSCSLASINAQAILRLVYGEEFDPCPLPPDNSRTQNYQNNSNKNSNDILDYLGQNIPNPFNNATIIPYRLPAHWGKATIEIFDITGKKLASIPLTIGTGAINLSCENYQQGVYLYKLIVDGIEMQTKRMVILK